MQRKKRSLHLHASASRESDIVRAATTSKDGSRAQIHRHLFLGKNKTKGEKAKEKPGTPGTE